MVNNYDESNVEYNAQIAEKIINKIHDKGWNVYDTREHHILGGDGVIENKLAETIVTGGRYILLPMIENSNNPKAVFSKLEEVAKKMGREMPTIYVGEIETAFTGFNFLEDDVQIHCPEGFVVTHDEFLKELEDIVDVTKVF